MTVQMPYTFPMVYLNALLIPAALGFVWLTVLFLLCFFAVHFIRLAKFGQQWRKTQAEKDEPKPAPPQEEKKTPPKESGEPIYYIVERKRRTKSSFGEPKRINFK